MSVFDSCFLLLDNPRSGVEAWAPTSGGFQGCMDTIPTPAPSVPTTSETRAAIIAAAEAWEAGQPAPTPLTRITSARRICQATDKQWRSVNAQIAALLDGAGVV